jgi:hypothetical protein
MERRAAWTPWSSQYNFSRDFAPKILLIWTELLLFEIVKIVFLKLAGSSSRQLVDDILLLRQDGYYNISPVQNPSYASKF